MNISNLKIGMIIKNYKELCKVLEIEVTDGNSKKRQLKEFAEVVTYHKEGNKFVIDDIDYSPADTNKGIHFHVVDENLLELTGGIVQGLSGSPILQDGKIIGAVTHVLVNDPTKGYGIFVEEMTKKI